MQQSPLQSKGGSEDDGSEDNNPVAAEVPPFSAPKEAPPLRAVPLNLDLEFSTAPESDDEEGDEEVSIIIDSPVAHLRRPQSLPLAKMPRSRLSRTLRPVPG